MTKKKKRCYAWIFAVLFAAVCGIPTVCWLFSPAIDTSDFSPQTNRNLAQMGDVRLLYDGLHLYKTNVNCGFAKSRKSIDGRPTFDMYASVFSDMEGEYVTEQYILYFQRVDNGITYDQQCHWFRHGNSRTCGTDYDLSDNDGSRSRKCCIV